MSLRTLRAAAQAFARETASTYASTQGQLTDLQRAVTLGLLALAQNDAGDKSANGTRIESPSVGLFWCAPSPGAPPFVEVGGRVSAGDTVAIVEVMKLMNHVASPVDGVVTGILVENGDSVEFGQPIVVVDPEG